MAGCTTNTSPNGSIGVSRDAQATTGPLLANKESKYSFDFDMTQPKIDEMTNWKSILNGFTDLWTNTHTPWEEMVFYNSPEGKKACSWGIDLVDQHSSIIKTIPFETYVKPNAKFAYTGHYEWPWIGLELSDKQKNKFPNQWRFITQANSGFLASLQETIPSQNEQMGFPQVKNE